MSAHNLARSPGHARGIMLVELIMSMGISVVVLAIALGTFATLSGALRAQQRITDCQLEQYDAISALEADIRSAGADPLGVGLYKDGKYPVEIIPNVQSMAGGLRIRTDRTGTNGVPDGDLDDAGEQIVYLRDSSSGVVNRWIATGTGAMTVSPVLTRADLFTAELLDRTGAATTPASTSQVRITFVTSIDPHESQPSGLVRREQFTLLLQNVTLAGSGGGYTSGGTSISTDPP